MFGMFAVDHSVVSFIDDMNDNPISFSREFEKRNQFQLNALTDLGLDDEDEFDIDTNYLP